MLNKKFVVGDIHGRYEAFVQVLEKSKFNYDKDTLIVLGDVVDGGADTYKCVEELMKIKNMILIKGNHDAWMLEHIKNGFAEEIWLQQGGANTLISYGADVIEAEFVSNNSKIDTTNLNIPVTHQDFFNRGVYYHVENEMLFVHGGFDTVKGLHLTDNHTLLWDRTLIDKARWDKIKGFKKIFVGHSTTQMYERLPEVKDCMSPIKFNNLIMVDTGAGWSGKLTIMDINTEEFWQSDIQSPAQRYVPKRIREELFK